MYTTVRNHPLFASGWTREKRKGRLPAGSELERLETIILFAHSAPCCWRNLRSVSSTLIPIAECLSCCLFPFPRLSRPHSGPVLSSTSRRSWENRLLNFVRNQIPLSLSLRFVRLSITTRVLFLLVCAQRNTRVFGPSALYESGLLLLYCYGSLGIQRSIDFCGELARSSPPR